MINDGLKLIAEGKVSVIIDACDPSLHQKLGCPKLLYRFEALNNMNLLEFILKRLKDLGSLAEKKHGKIIEHRDPIIPIICVNETEIDLIE